MATLWNAWGIISTGCKGALIPYFLAYITWPTVFFALSGHSWPEKVCLTVFWFCLCPYFLRGPQTRYNWPFPLTTFWHGKHVFPPFFLVITLVSSFSFIVKNLMSIQGKVFLIFYCQNSSASSAASFTVLVLWSLINISLGIWYRNWSRNIRSFSSSLLVTAPLSSHLQK